MLGGKRFFGKLLVDKLNNSGEFQVDTYSSSSKLSVDRRNKQDMESLFSKGYDIIIDNICFGSSDALIINEIFEKSPELIPKQYILTSTSFVYKNLNLKTAYDESIQFSFDKITKSRYPQIDYALGKQESEYILTKILKDKLLIIRPPYIIGSGDHTKRLENMIELVQQNKLIAINKNDLLPMSFVNVNLLSDVITYFIRNKVTGIFNISNANSLTNKEIFLSIANSLKKDISFQEMNTHEISYPYTLDQELVLNITKLKNNYPYPIEDIQIALKNILRSINEKK